MLVGLAMMMATGGAITARPPTVMASAITAEPAQRSGYPKLYRCASPIAQPVAREGYSPACIAWRDAELQRLSLLSPRERVARVTALRARMGLEDGEGLTVTPDGRLVHGDAGVAAR